MVLQGRLTGIGTVVPVFDILPHYEPWDQQDMLVNSSKFGAELASKFSLPGSPFQTHNVVLMNNHGFTTVGTSIKQAVYRAVYTHVNAGIQTNALMIRSAAGVKADAQGLRYLNEAQVKGSLEMNHASQDRPWGLWVREVEACPLYAKQSDA